MKILFDATISVLGWQERGLCEVMLGKTAIEALQRLHQVIKENDLSMLESQDKTLAGRFHHDGQAREANVQMDNNGVVQWELRSFDGTEYSARTDLDALVSLGLSKVEGNATDIIVLCESFIASKVESGNPQHWTDALPHSIPPEVHAQIKAQELTERARNIGEKPLPRKGVRL